MNGIIIAFLVILIGAINLDFYSLLKGNSKRYWKGQLLRLKIGIIYSAVMAYIAMPAIIFPDILVPIAILLLINSFITIYENRNNLALNKNSLKAFKFPIFVIVAILLFWILSPLIPLTQTIELHNLPNAKISNEQLSAVDPSHIRVVPLEYADWSSDKVIGELGYKVVVGKLTIQIIDGHLYWVAPLESGNFIKWFQFKTTPGYVIVDAEDENAKAERIDNLKLKYMQSALFQTNLYRHIYQKFPNYRLEDFTFELDDNKNPKWVVSVVKPTIWFTGEKVYGAIITDPQTGEMEFYELKKLPEWVDRAMPEKIAEDYNYWYGAYVHGYFNTLLSQKDIHLPTKKRGVIDVFAVRTDNGLVWFTGHTSPSGLDKSLTGYATINTRTGEMIYYENVSGYYNEEAAVSAADSSVSNFAGYYGAQPVFYNLFGELTWIIPILSNENNKLQRIAVVHAETGQVFVKEKLNDVLLDYKKWLESEYQIVVKGDIDIKKLNQIKGVIERIRGDYVVIRSNGAVFNKHIFKIYGPESLITYEGDYVAISYRESDEVVVDSVEFDNLEYEFV